MALNPVRPITKLPVGAAQARNHQAEVFPASVRGLSVSEPWTSMDPKTAVRADNVFLRRAGCSLRGGWRRWTTNIGGIGTEAEVLSVMAYQSSSAVAAVPKLFAAADDGNIYDVTDRTDESTVPAVDQALPGQAEPGILSWTNFSTAGVNYLCVVGAGIGYWTYDNAGGWVDRTANITGAGGAVASDFDFIMVWKNRIWFIKDNDTKAYYLAVNAIQGAAAEFDFGPLLVHGGDLQAMASWTLDGGDGVDDKLVLASSSGDVLIYGGTDPSSASTFGLIGRWFVGRPPSGRRFLSKYGGDLVMITESGFEYMSRMIQGHSLLDPNRDEEIKDLTRRYNEVIGERVRETRGELFWTLINLPSQEASILVTPDHQGSGSIQYAFGTLARGWSRMTNMPMLCAEEFQGDLYFGTTDGKMGLAYYGDSDDELTDGTSGEDLQADVQTAFVPPSGDGVLLKRPLLVQAMMKATEAPLMALRINTEWSLGNPSNSPVYVPSEAGLWDVAHWDVGIWGGGDNTYLLWHGAEGLGGYFSLRVAFKGKPGTTFTGWKVVYEVGGIM